MATSMVDLGETSLKPRAVFKGGDPVVDVGMKYLQKIDLDLEPICGAVMENRLDAETTVKESAASRRLRSRKSSQCQVGRLELCLRLLWTRPLLRYS